MKKLLCLVLLFAFPLAAQEKPKRRVADKRFWTVALTIVATTVFDVESTKRGLRNGRFETNPIFGRNPSRVRLYTITGISAGVMVYLSWRWKKQDMMAREGWERRFDTTYRGERVWEEPRPSWHIPGIIYSSITGGAGTYNLSRTQRK